MKPLTLMVLLLLCLAAFARTLTVGPGGYATPSAAAAAAKDGDVVEIAAGTYTGDVAVWRANDLVIRGVGERPRLDAAGKSAEGKAIWVIKGRGTTVERIEFTGCRVPDRNGAGIRQEGPGLTVRDCLFHHNEDGILTGAHPESDIVIEGCEFAHNGFGDGLSHNVYIGRVRSLTFRGNWSHHARIGHTLKSRAETNLLIANRFMDEADGTSSYLVNLPNGGRTFLIGNLLQHGPRAENGTAVSYAEEGPVNAVQECYVINNTFVNDRGRGRFLRTAGPSPVVTVVNNLIVGTEIVLTGDGALRRNLLLDTAGFLDAARYDYRLTAASPARGAGVTLAPVGGIPLLPAVQYRHPCGTAPRPAADTPDVGAYAFTP